MITPLFASYAGGAFGALIGVLAGAVCLVSSRRQQVQLEQTREELHIMLRQHQTEYKDGIAGVGRAVTFLEESAQNTESAVAGRMTGSVRSRAMKVLRSGVAPETAAVNLGVCKREMRLIAVVSRILSGY